MEFTLKNIDEKSVSLADFSSSKGVVVVFTCNHCPYAIAYEQRLIALHNRYAPQGYPIVAISANDATKYPQDSFEQMQVRAAQRGFPFAYLYDESQAIAHAYGATRTPHVFVLSRTSNGEWETVYEGAIDDNWQQANAVKQHYLEDVLDALLAGSPSPIRETPAVGCTIKWK